jgi:hypothetical protein
MIVAIPFRSNRFDNLCILILSANGMAVDSVFISLT